MKEIGGYFQWEISRGQSYHPDAVELNSARNCLAYLIRAKNIRKMAVPAYTCPLVWEVFEAEGCEMELYHIDADLMPDRSFDPDTCILYTNYFGLCTRQAEILEKRYPNLILDCAQAFYCTPMGIAAFYSPRKFFGVPDGGLLVSQVRLEEKLPVDSSLGRVTHLLKRIEFGAGAAYSDFKHADESLDGQPIKEMSPLTSSLLKGIDYDAAARKRRENYDFLHQALKDRNQFPVTRDEYEVPMVYPLLVKNGQELKKRLIASKIFVATYWAGQKDPGYGSELEKNLICLPVDQRYGQEDMMYILEVLDE